MGMNINPAFRMGLKALRNPQNHRLEDIVKAGEEEAKKIVDKNVNNAYDPNAGAKEQVDTNINKPSFWG